MTRPVLRARSTSHTVAAHDGCTKIPLAAHRAQEDENHSRKRRFRPWLASVRPPGSARTDQGPGGCHWALALPAGALLARCPLPSWLRALIALIAANSTPHRLQRAD